MDAPVTRYLIQLDDEDRRYAPDEPWSAALYPDRGDGKTGDILAVGVGATPHLALLDLIAEADFPG